MSDILEWHDNDVLQAVLDDPFAAAIRATHMAIIVTDPRKADNPIVFTNDAFLALTGYRYDEVIGHNCRFLQGRDTDPAAIRAIQDAVRGPHKIALDILNYRKDGQAFWNGLFISPVMGASGELHYFFAAQLDVTDRVEAQRQIASQHEWLEREVARRTEELKDALAAQTMLVHEVDHRVKNNIQMISALIAMQAGTIKDLEARASVSSILQRIEAIGTVHRRLYQAKDVRQFDLADFVRDIAHDLLKASGRDDIELCLDLESVLVPSRLASPNALMLNELMTNALKHAFPGGRSGRLAITVARVANAAADEDWLSIVLADDGIGMRGTATRTGFGSKLIKTLARQLQADVEWRDGAPGTIVELRSPLRRIGEDGLSE